MIKDIKKQVSLLINTSFKQITELGSMTIIIVFAIILIFLNKELAKRTILGIIGVVIISYSIKMIFFKNRPIRQSTDTLIEKIDASSFPSVHAARITVITFWLIIYFNNTYFRAFTIFIWMIVIYSRVYLKKHYWIDVIGGAIISLIINTIIHVSIFGSEL
ncbi:MAG: phosphatase PAP2 family protein [Candidatus Woesearchaeota archaeon]